MSTSGEICVFHFIYALNDIDVAEHATVSSEAPLRHAGIFRVQFDQDRIALQAICDEASGPCSTKRVEDDSALWAASTDAALGQLWGEGREVRLSSLHFLPTMYEGCSGHHRQLSEYS